MVMRRSRGFTVPEILIVVTVLAVLLGAGIPAFAEFIRNQRVKSASFDLFSTLVQARSEAITRNANVTVAPVSSVWANGWTVTDADGTVIRTTGAVPNITISGPASVVFRSSGRLNASTMPTFQLSATGSTVTTRCISIDLSGRPNTKAAACS
jgi:type IV fimbrial biogenesis protein FimT